MSNSIAESLVLVIDNSSSAISGLDKARQAAQKICYMSGAEIKVFMLDSSMPVPPATLRQAIPPGVNPHAQSCSLVARIMKTIGGDDRKQNVIIIGNGEIFDLEDWLDDPHVEGWLLIRTGDDSLQGSSTRISEIALDDIVWNDIDVLFSYITRLTPVSLTETHNDYFAGTEQIRTDKSGYPLIFVEPVGAFVHLFPITKPQFEKFMLEGTETNLCDEWYGEILELNPRASYCNRQIQSLEPLLMTGITSGEATSFARWLGRDFNLLSAADWFTCYEWFANRPAISAQLELAQRLSRDALAIWNILESQWENCSKRPSLQQLSLMSGGILEWVVERSGKYCGIGEPASPGFQRRPNDPVYPLGPEPRRIKNLGFRLCVRDL